MYRLRTLCGAAVLRDDAPLDSFTGQRNLIALLALLAAAGRRGISRDRIAALLWPESDVERARGSLKQALHTLRRQFGAGGVVAGTAELRLNGAYLESDVEEYLIATEAGDHLRAVDLYVGPFLDGFHLTGAPEFEQWLEEQRAALARQHADSLAVLAAAAHQHGAFDDAAALWRRIQAQDPFSARAMAGLMEALEAGGERSAALRAGQAYETLMREELGVAPDAAAVLSLIQQLLAVAMDAGRRDQAGERGEKLEGGEGEDRAAVAGGLRGQVEDLADAGIAVCCGGGAFLGLLAAALDTQALQCKGRSGAVTQQPLAPGGIGAMDADRGIEAEAAAGLPGEHVLDGVLVEQAAALEEAEHAALQRALEAEDVVCGEMGRLAEGDAAVVAVGEDAVEDDNVEVEVGTLTPRDMRRAGTPVEGGAEAVQERDGAELRAARSRRAGVVQGGADAAEQDAQYVRHSFAWVGEAGSPRIPRVPASEPEPWRQKRQRC